MTKIHKEVIDPAVFENLEATSFKLTDGNEGEGKVLSSNAVGIGEWRYPSGTFPVGAILDMAAGTPPGFLNCDGSEYLKATYPALSTYLGNTWGVAPSGVLYFVVPNLNRRGTVGSGGTGTVILGSAVGDVGGSETVALSVDQLPAHTHTTYIATSPFHPGEASETYRNIDSEGTTSALPQNATGSGEEVSIIQPSAVVRKVIKY